LDRTKNHAEVDVLALVGNVFPAHELFYLEELGQVQVLLRGDNVDHAAAKVLAMHVNIWRRSNILKVVLLNTLNGSANITGQIE
jgi:hypothetical protein